MAASEESKGPHRFISTHLPAMLAGTVQTELFEERPEHPLEEGLSGLGALSRSERARIFEESMREIVFPGLERFEIDAAAGRRWLDDQLSAAKGV